ncbi:MAG TPA: DoxX family protein [Chitinophagaceae bacterium]|nr:DoxX family protein [Chitinophagaceae bacterium]
MKIASTRYSDTAFNFATFILRIGGGSLMLLNHGLMKLNHFGQMSNNFINPFHIGSATTLAIVIFAEVFCSALVILGLFTRWVCIPLVIEMAFAFVQVHHMKYSPPPAGGELPLLFLTIFLALLFTGPGQISVDRLIGK